MFKFLRAPSRRPAPQTMTERGSVLIYIFIAIAALAALTFAVSRGGRQSAETINKERAELQVTEILDYAGMMRRSVQGIIINGGTASQLCFNHENWGNSDYDPVAGAPNDCPEGTIGVFDKAGGGANFSNPDPDLLDSDYSAQARYGQWYFTGGNSVAGVGLDDGTEDSNELLLVLPYIKRSICESLNRKLQVDNPATIPVDDANFSMTTPFTGTFDAGYALNAVALDGKRSGCFEAETTPADGSFVFYSVLIAR